MSTNHPTQHLTWALSDGNTQSLRKTLGSKSSDSFYEYSSDFLIFFSHFSHLMQPPRKPKGAIWGPTPQPQARAR